MPTKAVKIETISTDVDIYTAWNFNNATVVIEDQYQPANSAAQFTFKTNPEDPTEVFPYHAEGGSGGRMIIGITTFDRKHYPDNLDDIGDDEELKEFVRNTKNGYITSATIIDPGFGYLPNDKVDIHGTMAFATFSFENVEATDITSDVLRGAENSYWQNNHYSLKKVGNLYYRQLGKNDTHKMNITGNKFERVNGWQNLFTGTAPADEMGPKGYNAQATQNFQFKTDNMISAHQGIILGHVYGHQKNEKQRWTIPEGVMFSWTSKNSKKNSSGLRLKEFRFLWKLKGERVTTFNYLIHGGNFVDENDNEIIGDSPFKYHNGKNPGWGALKCYMPREDYELLHKREAACIGMMIMYENHSQSANYNNVIDYFNFRSLFSRKSHPNYRMILPASSRMVDYQTYGFRLA